MNDPHKPDQETPPAARNGQASHACGTVEAQSTDAAIHGAPHSLPYGYEVGIASAIGPRERLEDYGFAITMTVASPNGDRHYKLLGVFDGVGGAQRGHIASRTAARVCAAHLSSRAGRMLGGRPPRTEHWSSTIRTALRRASEAIRRGGTQSESRGGPATTATVAVVYEGTLIFASVGDSRACLVHEGELRRLSTDHTKARMLIEHGQVSPEQADAHPDAHVLTRFLGSPFPPEPCMGVCALAPGDAVVLLTDGVHGVLGDAEVASIVSEATTAQDTASRLVEESLRRGTGDNASAVCCMPSRMAMTSDLPQGARPTQKEVADARSISR